MPDLDSIPVTIDTQIAMTSVLNWLRKNQGPRYPRYGHATHFGYVGSLFVFDMIRAGFIIPNEDDLWQYHDDHGSTPVYHCSDCGRGNDG